MGAIATLALCQTEGRFADPAGALDLLAAEARDAASAGADLLVLPELFLTGYNLGPSRARALALDTGSPALARAQEIARAEGIALCFGFPELVGDAVANSAALIDEAGGVRLIYRKAHLFGDLDRDMFAVRGEGFPLVAWRGLSLGVAICYDIEFPETARVMALAGADLVLVPTALMPPYHVVAEAL
ncbi:MAG: nitrilase, partial [Acidiphilium sp. 37-67-22]